jgi:hypothetical protein
LVHCEFREVLSSDFDIVLAHIRNENVQELEMDDSLQLETIMKWCISESLVALTGVIGGEPVCIFGVVDHGDNIGQPWMFGTSLIDKHAVSFLKASRYVIGRLLNDWPKLENWTDARNARGLRWLKFMGFTIHPAEPYGPKGLPFHRVERSASCASH